ncbi:MAG: hypothetical protein STSR0002_15470 [Smithella sp.]|jgi:hypothetical protein
MRKLVISMFIVVFVALLVLDIYVLREFFPPPSRSLPGACRVTPLQAYAGLNAPAEDIK